MPRRIADDDTIVVKGDVESSIPSSPVSIGSDIEREPRGAMNTPQHLESPEPESSDRATGPRAVTSGSGHNNNVDSTPAYLHQIPHKDPSSASMEERLQMMPLQRSLPFRDTVEPGAELEVGGNSRRKQIRFGCLLATRGDIAPEPCASCANGRGKFTACIALPGFFKGACASCQLSGRPNRCSIKKHEDEAEASSPSPSIQDQTQDRTPAQQMSTTQQNIDDRAEDINSSGPSAKRIRVEEPPRWTEPPVWDQGLGSGSVRGRGRPPRALMGPFTNAWATVNSSPAPAHAPVTRNSSTVNNTRSSASRNSLSRLTSTPKEETRPRSSSSRTNTPQSSTSRHGSKGWATLNQTQPQPQAQAQSTPLPQPQSQSSSEFQSHGQPQTKAEPQPELLPQSHNPSQIPQQIPSQAGLHALSQPQQREPSQTQQSHSQSQPQHQPQPQAQIPITSLKQFVDQQLLEKNGVHRPSTLEPEGQAGKSSIPTKEGTPPTSLMEILPKNKQRHIYGIISGIQGGIDHLNRELDALKKVLGIDDDN
ncbi:hypothetical protein CJF32_00001903 [Rutstroemia sp. NJR-2017a WRK4]|nr:hypothetical protein CJF32_00001903 [Rutstroemia sp. NJR-2017a WRK4]